ncbi:hypothetical protein PTSG_06198 [Salpingoeca rosetta]|uniref:Uncharacterized protein n=1 Tax=Salpingoeca rosetta (strain ATCC 50818 / BSB-021) TaxID=946362 RepID=F2UC81_SALR5|nr:uncharacterized protein PTSG_06198 [Salpingoeca rosetta]EGD74188.1 hypothetical protein PTSG_06198 [Salpingoeca rosetta]|eukprot:XP_004993088.1 hypothetical protein PTSG_06198 [Salpingoeca rosetta]
MGGLDISGDVVAVAASTVGSVLMLSLVGVFVAHYPKHPSGDVRLSGMLQQSSIRQIAKVATTVYIPCLAFTRLGSRLSIDTMKEVWPMVLYAPAQCLLGTLVAWLVCRVFLVPKQFRQEFILACSHPNMIAVPLVMLEVLCQQSQLAGEDSCSERSAAFVFVSVVGWYLYFWTVGLETIKHLSPETQALEANQGGEGSSTIWQSLKQLVNNFFNPPLIGSLSGLVVGLVPELQDLFFGGKAPLLFSTSAAKTYAAAVVGVMSTVMFVTLGKSIPSLDLREHAAKLLRMFRPADKRSLEDVEVAGPDDTSTNSSVQLMASRDSISVGAVLAGPSQCSDQPSSHQQQHTVPASYDDNGVLLIDVDRVLEENHLSLALARANGQDDARATSSATVPPSATALKLLVPATSNATTTPEQKQEKDHQSAASWGARNLVLFVVTSMLVLPGSKLGLIIWLGPHVFGSGANAALVQLVLCIQSITPTANLLVVVCQREGARASAERMSRGILLQYTVAIGSLLIFTALGVAAFY